MIRLKCSGGQVKLKDGTYQDCDYSVEYPDEWLPRLVNSSKEGGGFHCPACRRFKLKVQISKSGVHPKKEASA